MSNQNYRQEIQEEAEFLRKRTWDFIAKIEKLESKRKTSTDASKREKLQVQIANTNRLLEDYKIQYKNICEEAGIELESLSITAPSRDLASFANLKSEKTYTNIKRGEEAVDLPPFFVEVPSRNPKFTGRKDYVRNFIQQVLKGGAFSICGVKGMGGIGKTEIAKEVCHIFHETWKKKPKIPEYVTDLLTSSDNSIDKFFLDGILWIQFEPEKQTPQILTEYIIPKLANDPRIIDKITNLEILANTLKDKNVLVVLDSVEQNLRTFDFVLERFKGKFPIIITSRVAIPGIQSEDIDVLSDEEAKSLFIRNINIPEKLDAPQNKTIEELCKLLGNYPLIIERIAALVNDEKSNLNEIKEEFNKNRTALLSTSSNNKKVDSKHVNISTCFMMSLNSLGDIERNAFLHSALFNNPFTASALATIINNDDEKEVKQIVTHLLHKSLISQTINKEETPSYYLHPLMREFALDLLMKTVAIDIARTNEIKGLLSSLQRLNKKNTLLKQLQDNHALIIEITKAMEYCDHIFDFSTILEFMKIVNESLGFLGYLDQKIYLNKIAVRASVGLQYRQNEGLWLRQVAESLDQKAISNEEYKYVYTIWNAALLISQQLKETSNILFIKYRITCIYRKLEEWNMIIPKSNYGLRETLQSNSLYWHSAFLSSLFEVPSLIIRSEKAKQIGLKISATNLLPSWRKQNHLLFNNELIGLLSYQGYINECIPLYRRQLKLSQLINSATVTALTASNLFNCYIRLQDKAHSQEYWSIYKKLTLSSDLPKNKEYILVGKLAWLNKNYDNAIRAFKKALLSTDLKKYNCHYWLGKTYLYQGQLNKAERLLNRALQYHENQKQPLELAKIYSQLAFLLLKRKETLNAIKTLHKSLKTKKENSIIISLEEEQIEKKIYNQFIKEGGNKDQYNKIVSQVKAIDLQPDFILPELSQTYQASDNKTMQLVSEGPVFIGEGEIENLTTKELLDNIEQYLYPYKQHSNEYILPAHPDSDFDEDKLLFLLEQNKSISEEDKQKLVKTATINTSDIKQLIDQLDLEYQRANLKATEIYLYPFYMDRDPVSNTEYLSFCKAIDHSTPDHWIDGMYPKNSGNQPVINVSLEDAKAYAKWAGKKIPISAEWEKACRGENGDLYPWGNTWDVNYIKALDTNLRAEYEKSFEELNKPELTPGCANLGDEHTFTIPDHPLTEFDNGYFLDLLERSLSLSLAEKQRVITAMPTLSQFQVDELIKVFTEERTKFIELEKKQKHPEDLMKLRRKAYFELKHPLLLNKSSEYLSLDNTNTSCYGINNLVGSVYQHTITEAGKQSFVIKGGSWFSRDPEKSCKGWSQEIIEADVKRADTGFRCVIPIFSKDDLEDEMLA